MRQKEIEHAMGLIGNIKKAYQKEKGRLKLEGVDIRMKPVWQAIHDSIHSLQKLEPESDIETTIETIRNYPLASDLGLCEQTPCRECNACENLKGGLIKMIQDGTRLTAKPTLQQDEKGEPSPPILH